MEQDGHDLFQLTDSPLRPRPVEDHGPIMGGSNKSDMFDDGPASDDDTAVMGFPDMEAVVNTEVFNLKTEGHKYSDLKTRALRDSYGLKGHSTKNWIQILWEERHTTKDGTFVAAVSWAEYTNNEPEKDAVGGGDMSEADYGDGKEDGDEELPSLLDTDTPSSEAEDAPADDQ